MYQVEITIEARDQLTSIPNPFQNTIKSKLLELDNPIDQPNVKKVRNLENYYRIRVGDYRALYRIIHKKLLVIVVYIDHKRNFYQSLDKWR